MPASEKTADPTEAVLVYHEETKHHYYRLARSLGYLDWESQPDPFRVFDGALKVRLPLLPQKDAPTYDAIYNTGAVRLTDSVIADNFCCELGGGFGGAIYSAGTMTIADSILADNFVADGSGGAIWNAGILAITNSTLARNGSWGRFVPVAGAIANGGEEGARGREQGRPRDRRRLDHQGRGLCRRQGGHRESLRLISLPIAWV